MEGAAVRELVKQTSQEVDMGVKFSVFAWNDVENRRELGWNS